MSDHLKLFAKMAMGEAKLLSGFFVKNDNTFYPNKDKIKEEFKNSLAESTVDFYNKNVYIKIEDKSEKEHYFEGLYELKNDNLYINNNLLSSMLNDLSEGEVVIQIGI